MNKKQMIAIVVLLAAGGWVGMKIIRSEKPVVAAEHDHGGHGKDEPGHDEHGHGDEHGELERVKLTPTQFKNSGIVIETTGPARIRTSVKLYGKIAPNEDHVAHVRPRYAGVVKKVGKRLGEVVKKGDLLAVIESSESLQPYDIKAEIDGTIVEKEIAMGEVVSGETKIYVIADLGAVWVNLNVYRRDFPRMRVGQPVLIDAGEGVGIVESTIAYISAFGAESTQTMLARAEIPNPTGLLRPGLFVTGEVVMEEVEVPIAVRSAAIQTWEEREVVFVHEGEEFEGRPVRLGRRDSQWAEVVGGIYAGENYVTTNSFILKAELGKAGAAHEH